MTEKDPKQEYIFNISDVTEDFLSSSENREKIRASLQKEIAKKYTNATASEQPDLMKQMGALSALLKKLKSGPLSEADLVLLKNEITNNFGRKKDESSGEDIENDTDADTGKHDEGRNGDRFKRPSGESAEQETERFKSQYEIFEAARNVHDVTLPNGEGWYLNNVGGRAPQEKLNYAALFDYFTYKNPDNFRDGSHHLVERQINIQNQIQDFIARLAKSSDAEQEQLRVSAEDFKAFVRMVSALKRFKTRFEKQTLAQKGAAYNAFKTHQADAELYASQKAEAQQRAQEQAEDDGHSTSEDSADPDKNDENTQTDSDSSHSENKNSEAKTEGAESDEKKASPSDSPFDAEKRTDYKERSDSFKEEFEGRSVEDLVAQIDRLQELINTRRKGAALSHADASKGLDGYAPLKLQLGKLKAELARYADKTLNREDYEHIHQIRGAIAQYGMQFRASLSEYKKGEKPEPNPDDPKPKPGPEPEPDPVNPDDPDDPKPKNEAYENSRTGWMEAKRALAASEKEYFAAGNQQKLKEVAQELENSGKLGRLFSKEKREKYVELQGDERVLKLKEDAYRDSKQEYLTALRTVLNERKARGNDEKGFDDYKATIGARFFAKQGDTGYREDKAGRDLRSYHDKEQALNESILPEGKKSLYCKTKDVWAGIPTKYKVGVGAAAVAGSLVLDIVSPTRLLTGVVVGALTNKLVNAGIFSNDKFAERFAKKVEAQRDAYNTVRTSATASISPENFKSMEESIGKEFSAIKVIEKKNETKLEAVKIAKATAVIGTAVLAGSQVETDPVGDLIKGMFTDGTSAPLPASDVSTFEAPPSVTVTELPPIPSEVPAPETVTPDTVESTPSEPAVVDRVTEGTRFVPSTEHILIVPDQYGGTDTLSETVFEAFKAGDINGSSGEMSRTEFLNKMYSSLEALKGNDRILELMSVEGNPPLEGLDLVYKDASYDIQPLIDHMNGVPLDQIEANGRYESYTYTTKVPADGFVVPPEGAGSVLEGIATPEVSPAPAESVVVPPTAEAGTPAAGADSVLEGAATPTIDPAPDVSIAPEGASSVLEGATTSADSVLEGLAAAGGAESVPPSLSMGEITSSQAMLESLGFKQAQIDIITAEANSRHIDGMTPVEDMSVLEAITQREMLTARLDAVAGVSSETGIKLLFNLNPAELVDALNQGTLESLMESSGVKNPGFYTPIIEELHRTGLIGNGSSFANVLENALSSRQIEIMTTILGEEKIKIGTGGLFGNAKTINL